MASYKIFNHMGSLFRVARVTTGLPGRYPEREWFAVECNELGIPFLIGRRLFIGHEEGNRTKQEDYLLEMPSWTLFKEVEL